MEKTIRAIYNSGQLRLLDPVNLADGQQIELRILSQEERVRIALGDLLVQSPETANDDIDEAALAREVEEAFRDLPPLSETIIEERHDGP